MAFNFPTSPTVGLVYTGPNNIQYTWDGVTWIGGAVGPAGPAGPAGVGTTWSSGSAGTGPEGLSYWYRAAPATDGTAVIAVQTGRVRLTSPVPVEMQSYTPGGAGIAGTDFGGIVYFPRSFARIDSVVLSGLGTPRGEIGLDNDFDGRMVGQFEYNWSQTSLAVYARRLVFDTPLVAGTYLTVSYVAYGLA